MPLFTNRDGGVELFQADDAPLPSSSACPRSRIGAILLDISNARDHPGHSLFIPTA